MERHEREIRQTEVVTKSPILSWNYGNLPPAYKPASESGTVGQACGNCEFFDANYCTFWNEVVHLVFHCKSWKPIDVFEYNKTLLKNIKDKVSDAE